MNRCPNCAAQNRDGAKFCTSCGFRLPAEEVVAETAAVSGRSPFSTTSTVDWSAENQSTFDAASANDSTTEEDPNGYAAWTTPIPAVQTANGPGASWEAPPPVDTAVPVSDEMIASLMGDSAVVADDAPAEPQFSDESPIESPEEVAVEGEPEVDHPIEETHPAAEFIQDAEPFVPDEIAVSPAIATPYNPPTTAPADLSIDDLLKLARELEYGLMELADAETHGDESANLGLLSGALHGLTSEDDLGPLRHAIATAQDRPRDVDVMLDLVLRADAIASIIGERDQLKSAIELALREAGQTSEAESDNEEATADE